MRYKKTILLIVAFVGIAVLGLVLVKFFPDLPIISDSEDYNNIAHHILTEREYFMIPDGSILYPPLYPIFLSVLYLLGLGVSGVYLVQFLLVGGISVLVFYILKRFSKANLGVSLVASLCVLIWPYFILYSQLISSEVLYSFLLILFFTLFLHIQKSSPLRLPIFSGLILGLAILTRPVALLLLPWIFIALLLLQRIPGIIGELSLPWKKYLFVFLAMICIILPWEIYVQKTYDRVIPISTNLSPVFNKANKTKAYLSQADSGAKEISLIEAKVKNLYLFWDPGASGYHLDIIKEKYPIAQSMVVLYKLIFFVIVTIAFIGALLLKRQRLILFSTSIILYFWALHTVLFPFPRYTLPIIPFVIIVAGVTLTHVYKQRSTYSHSNTSV